MSNNSVALTTVPTFSLPGLSSALSLIEERYAEYSTSIVTISDDIRKTEMFLIEKRICLPYAYLIQKDEESNYSKTYSLVWDKYEKQGFRLIYRVEETWTCGDYPNTCAEEKPAVEWPSSIRNCLYSHLLAFLQGFCDHVTHTAWTNENLIDRVRKKAEEDMQGMDIPF